MRRIVLALLMLGDSLLPLTTAQASLNLECGHSYAFEMHGTEPSLTSDAALHYIVGVGQLTLGPQTPPGAGNGCTITHGELIYSDNDVLTHSAGPTTCYAAQSLLGGGIPCFNGGTSPSEMTGSLVSGNDGGAVLSLVATEGWLNGAATPSSIPLSFNIQGNSGNHLVMGSSVPDFGPAPTSAPPGSPVLVLTMEHQHPAVTLPVTGPGPQPAQFPPGYLNPAASPLTCTGGGCNGFGVAPYLGLSISLFQGYSAPSADQFTQPIAGTFGSTISSLQIFPNGEAGGSASFNTNDNVGNTSGASNNDCDVGMLQTGNFSDGTSNDAVWMEHPGPKCSDASIAATFELSTVQRSVADSDTFSIMTGLSASTLTGGLVIPAGLMSDAIGLSSVPAGSITNLTSATIVAINSTKTGTVKITNNSPAGCDVSISMPASSASNGGASCSLAGFSTTALVEGDTASTPYATISCTCSGGVSPAVSTTSTVTLTSSDCPLSGSTSPMVNCKN